MHPTKRIFSKFLASSDGKNCFEGLKDWKGSGGDTQYRSKYKQDKIVFNCLNNPLVEGRNDSDSALPPHYR